MYDRVAWIDGWEVRLRNDGGYGVYDDHGLVAGPFGTVGEAVQAAAYLPRNVGNSGPNHSLEPSDKEAVSPSHPSTFSRTDSGKFL